MSEKFDALMDSWRAGLKGFLEPVHHLFDIFSNMWMSFGIIALVFVLLLTYCILTRRKDFQRHMKRPQTLAVCSLMIAMNIVLGYFTLWISSYLSIGFGFVTQPIVTMLFGPLVGCMTGMVQDILSYLLNPAGGAYVPTYTLCVGISGLFYGLVLYRKPVTLRRVFLAKLLVILVSNILLNSIALAPTVGSGFIGILPARILKNLLLLPIQTIVVYMILKFVKELKPVKAFEAR